MRLKTTRSLCPVCNAILEAEVVEEDGGIWIVRTCPEHGTFRDVYWSDADMWHRFERFESVGAGLENPQRTSSPDGCPLSCGLCENHRSHTLLANIDLTNRCNLNCDFCFANARACGYIYEPTFEQVVEMLTTLRSNRPVPAPAVQFSGGEPTMRDDLMEIIGRQKNSASPRSSLRRTV